MAQTHVLVNGRWQARTIDMAQIIAQNNRKPQSASAAPLEPASHPPSVGVLTRTITQSPVIRWIFAACIRYTGAPDDKLPRDAVLVRETSVEIKELVKSSEFRDVAVKADFDARILSAGVLTLPKAAQPTDAELEEQSDAYWQIMRQRAMRGTSPSPEPTSSSDAMDFETKGPRHLPHQILALSLRSGLNDWLCFLYATREGPKGTRFVHRNHLFDAPTSQNQRLGKRLAIDPLSRAIAVAAQEGRFAIFALKSKEQMDIDIEDDKFDPLVQKGCKTLMVDGMIHRMEFLYPPIDDASSVILMLVLCIDGDFVLRRYDWDCSQSIDDIKVAWSGLDIPVEWNMPLLLIPIRIAAGFLLVCEDHAAIFSNVLVGSATARSMPLPCADDEDPDPSNSRTAPLWTAWARPPDRSKRDGLAADVDHLFLAREDGLIRYISLKKSAGGSVQLSPASHDAGRFDVNVDQAVAILDTDHFIEGASDVLVTAGNMSDGGLYQIPPYRKGALVHSIPNWAPIPDMAVIPYAAPPANGHTESALPSLCGKNRVFTCSGSGSKHGSIREIRTGVRGQVHAEHFLEDSHGCSRLWPVRLPPCRGQYLVESFPDSSDWSYLSEGAFPNAPQHAPGNPLDDSPNRPFISTWMDASSPTLEAGLTWTEVLVQVTPTAIRALFLEAKEPYDQYLQNREIEGSFITHASLDPRSSSILLCLRNENRTNLRLARLQAQDQSVDVQEIKGCSLPKSQEPCSVFLCSAEHHSYGFVGTSEQKLLIVLVSDEVVPSRNHSFAGDDALCDSICVIPCQKVEGEARKYRVFCGLRNGELHVLILEHGSDQGPSFFCLEILSVGTTSVTIISEPSIPQASPTLDTKTLLVCRENLYWLFYPSRAASAKACLQQIWLTSSKKEGLPPPEIAATIMALPPVDNRNSTSTLLRLENEHLQLVELDSIAENHIIPWVIPIGGTPSRVVYLPSFHKLVVAYSEFHTLEPSLSQVRPEASQKRLQFPKLVVVDPDKPSTSLRVQSAIVLGKSGEKVVGLTEWVVKEGPRTWRLVIACTSNSKNGRIAILGPSLNDNGDFRLEVRHETPVKEPPFSIAQYNQRAFCYCAGTTLYMATLAPDEEGRLKIRTRCHSSLRSPAQFLTVRGPFIYASTVNESVMIFRVDEQSDQMKQISGDQESRNSLTHRFLPEHSLILTSHLHGVVHGLWQNPADPSATPLTNLFDIKLPSSVSRFWASPTLPAPTLEQGNTTIDARPSQSSSIIGSAIDGAFYRFDLLDVPHWSLLSWLQTLASTHPEVCPHTHKQARFVPMASRSSSKRLMHIDGDILARIVTPCNVAAGGGVELLRDVVGGDMSLRAPPEERHSPQERLQQFAELVNGAFGEREGSDPFEVVMEYLKRTLHQTARA